MSDSVSKGLKFFKTTDITSVKAELSSTQITEIQKRVDMLITELTGVTDMLRGSRLLLLNGSLTSGGLKFAAFRVQTLSLLFEYAQKYITKSQAPATYADFLTHLGYEVGFTYARELLGKLRDLRCLPEDDLALIELWIQFENETGAGITNINKVGATNLEIVLERNPLGYYYDLDGEHSHCHFYCEYYRAILNEFMTNRPRLARDLLKDIKPTTIWKVPEVKERARKGMCSFECELRQERLTGAFDMLHDALEHLDKKHYGDAISLAREALLAAQKTTLSIVEEKPTESFFECLKPLLPKKDYGLMHDTYHRLSALVHKKTLKDPNEVRKVVLDTHYCIHNLERLEVAEGKLA